MTSIDKKAAYIQDATGAAVYVFFGYTAPYSNTLKTLQIGKEYTICGYYDNYSGFVQLKTPVLSGEAKDPETAIVAKDLDEAAYKALTINNSAELVNLKGLKVNGGKFMLGETAIAYYTGNVADANKADLEAMVALLKDGVNFDLVNVNVCVNKNAVQIEIVRASSIVIDWEPVATIDIAEIGVEVTAQITVTAKPAVTTDIKATFVSDHPEIAKVDENGKVTGVAAGDAIITVTANGKTTTVAVKVVATVEKFAVNFTKTGTNGNITTVTVDGTEINPGDEVVKGKTIVVTVAPADGFRLASVTIGEGAADTSVAGKTSFELTITANTTFAVAFEEKPATKTLQKATSIAVGDQIVLAYESGSKKYEMGTYAKGFFNIAAYTDVPAQAQLLTVVAGAAEGQFAFKTASGKYLTLTTDGNKLFESELSAVNEAASWTVTFDANGNIVITSVKYTKRFIQFNANSGQERFATYTGSQKNIIAYKLV
ncbi:MAG: Ig-like domain-containing protein [Christensenella sp.]|nr:MAG: Ig-like domain-containing protein [Christensenella sp.]